MSKSSLEKREALAAAGRRLGLGKRDNKVSDLRERIVKPVAKTEVPKRSKRHHDSEPGGRMVAEYKLTHLRKADVNRAYDVTDPTRYPEVVMLNAPGNVMLDKVLRRHAHVMKPQGITPKNFKMWREHFMFMNPEQLGALVRVTGRKIRDWENGSSKIPFSMWWVMHVTMQDPEYFLTRPGFHDFYIEYVDGTAHLCSHTYPDIRWTVSDLYFNRCSLNEVMRQRETIKKLEENLQSLTAENTRLRQMLKTGGVTGELQAMQDQIGAMMKRIQTADVVPLQPSQIQPLTLSKATA